MTGSTNYTVELPWEMADDNVELKVEELARQLLDNDCPYSFYFREIDIDFTDGVLMLRGRVPSFYLKQVLQAWLSSIEGVSRIDNQVDVTSATGLSSVRPPA